MNDQLHVVLLVADFDTENTGGLTRFAEALAYALDKEQFKVTLLALWQRNTNVERKRIARLTQDGFNPVTLANFDAQSPYRAFFKAFQKLPEVVHQLQPDLIHCHSEFGEIALVFLKLLRGLHCPALRTAHNFEWKKRPLRRVLLSRFAYLWAFTAEYGVSEQIVETLNRRWFASRAKYIPNAVNLRRFVNASPDLDRLDQWRVKPDTPLIMSIGRLTPQKGFPDLIEAANYIRQVIPEVCVLIIGEGPDHAALQTQIEAADLQDHIILTGTQSQIETLLPCATLYVSSSHWEGLPTVILESMAANVPVIATDISGNNTLVQHGKTGWLVPVNNPKALAEQIENALTQSPSHSLITQRALQHAQQFDIQRIAAQYATEYRQNIA